MEASPFFSKNGWIDGQTIDRQMLAKHLKRLYKILTMTISV
jgi:hypothetical protein